jgi:tartrate dehydratase beta subunit/fumarate hydratase class I family protein
MASRKLCLPSTAVYHAGLGSDPMIEVGSMTPADALNMAEFSSSVFE